jgi:hypothetical protein
VTETEGQSLKAKKAPVTENILPPVFSSLTDPLVLPKADSMQIIDTANKAVASASIAFPNMSSDQKNLLNTLPSPDGLPRPVQIPTLPLLNNLVPQTLNMVPLVPDSLFGPKNEPKDLPSLAEVQKKYQGEYQKLNGGPAVVGGTNFEQLMVPIPKKAPQPTSDLDLFINSVLLASTETTEGVKNASDSTRPQSKSPTPSKLPQPESAAPQVSPIKPQLSHSAEIPAAGGQLKHVQPGFNPALGAPANPQPTSIGSTNPIMGNQETFLPKNLSDPKKQTSTLVQPKQPPRRKKRK